MRRIFVLLYFCGISTIFSQTTTLEPGVYKSNVKGQNVMLKVFEDNKYEMSFLYGKFTVDNDTISFKSKPEGESGFKVKVNKTAEYSSTLKIKIKAEYLMYFGQNIYLGTQKEDNAMVEYKPIFDYLREKDKQYSERKTEYTLSIDKVKYLYFVENIQPEASISKFQIDPETNMIEMEYEGLAAASIQLKGKVDPETKKLTIMEGRRASPIFVFEKEGTETPKVTDENLKPLTVQYDKEWKKNNGFEEEENTEYFGEREAASYTFKHTNFKNYDEALKNTAKSESKFLAIVFDNSKDAPKKFNSFIKSSEEEMTHYMRRGYNASRDHFNFYLASEKDKALLEKFKIKNQPVIVFLNSNGELLYHTDGALEGDNSDKFNPRNSIADELTKTNAKLKLDKILSNKKASVSELKKGFLAITKAKGGSSYDYDAVADSTAVEVQEDYDGVAVDTAVAAVAEPRLYDDDYFRVDDQQNLYLFKANKNTVAEKWKSIVAYYTKENEYDADFIEIAKRELIGHGFTSKLFDGEASNYDLDFKILDYIFKNYELILKKENPTEPLNEYDDMGYRLNEDEDEVEIARILSSFFSKRLGDATLLDTSSKEKYIKYNKMFLKVSGYNLSNFKTYIEQIGASNPTDKALYFSEFEDFFNTFTSKNQSVIETLDVMYVGQKDDYMDWNDYKQIYSGLANTVAWDVVELKTKDQSLIQKAIQWSESSLKVDPKSPYYLDTLAQLYYMNNQKDKAIATEQRAIDSIKDNDTDQIQTYTDVLEKMKNGTY